MSDSRIGLEPAVPLPDQVRHCLQSSDLKASPKTIADDLPHPHLRVAKRPDPWGQGTI